MIVLQKDILMDFFYNIFSIIFCYIIYNEKKDIAILLNSVHFREHINSLNLKNSSLYNYFIENINDNILGPIIYEICKEFDILYDIYLNESFDDYIIKVNDVDLLIKNIECIGYLKKDSNKKLCRILKEFAKNGSSKSWNTFFNSSLMKKYYHEFTYNFIIKDIIIYKNEELLKYFIDNIDTDIFYESSILYFKNNFIYIIDDIDQFNLIIKYIPLSKVEISNIISECLLKQKFHIAKMFLDIINI